MADQTNYPKPNLPNPGEQYGPEKPGTLKRYTINNGQLYDGGIPSTHEDLRKTLIRNYKAIENNQQAGPLGEKANVFMIKEYNEMHEIYKKMRPDLYQK